MATFAYKAIDRAGKQAAGTLVADSRAAALDEMAQKGLYAISVEEVQPQAAARPSRPGRIGRVSAALVEEFTRELANLLAAGVPLSRALRVIEREATHPAARQLWAAIHEDVAGGASLADALARWPRCFPPVYVAIVRAGETGGFLDVALGQIADFRAREQELKSRVKAALIYPMVLGVLASLVLVFLLVFFIPRFSTVFAEFGGSLPALTRAIVAVSRAVTRHGIVVAIVCAAAVLLGRRVLSTDSGRRAAERAALRMPGLGRATARFALVRFCRMLGTLVGTGVPLVTALRVAREAVGNQTLADTLTGAIEQVQQGASLARSLAQCPLLFPAAVVESVAVAEQTGRLDKELVRLAAAYENDLDRRLRALVAMAEPALLFLMAAIIGTVVVGMLLPVFTLQELIR